MRAAGSRFERSIQQRQREHRVRNHGPDNTAGDLHRHVQGRIARRQVALERKNQRNGGIEMRTRDRTENTDQDHKDRTGRKRVAKQRKRHIPGQAFGHDAGADHGCDQQTRPKRLRHQAARQIKVLHERASF